MGAESIQSVFSRVAARYKLQGEFQAAHICYLYKGIVCDFCGESLANKTTAKYVKNKVLWVKARNSAAAQRLQLNKHILLEKIQAIVGKEHVDTIKITQN